MARKQITNGSTTSPEQFYFYFNGVQIGQIGNNGDDNTNYAAAIAQETATPGTGPFAGGATTGTSSANFDLSYQAMNPTAAGEAGAAGSYTVQSGDTLASIAQNVWGDASLWYTIAQANGIQSDSALAAGMSLTIPAKVENLHDNASTFKVYNPAKALGDVQPGAPVPQSDDCALFGAIVGAIIAVVLSVVIPPVGSALTNLLLTMGEMVVGNVIGQGIGVFVGTQHSINWKEVGITAISALFTSPSTGDILADIANAAIASAETQGVSIALGLQHKFDWGGVAAAAISAGIAPVVDRFVTKTLGIDGAGAMSIGHIANRGLSNLISAGITAAGRSLITGTDFGDNLVSALPGVVGNTIGELARDSQVEAAMASAKSADRNSGSANSNPAPQPGNDTAKGAQVVAAAAKATDERQVEEIVVTASRGWTPKLNGGDGSGQLLPAGTYWDGETDAQALNRQIAQFGGAVILAKATMADYLPPFDAQNAKDLGTKTITVWGNSVTALQLDDNGIVWSAVPNGNGSFSWMNADQVAASNYTPPSAEPPIVTGPEIVVTARTTSALANTPIPISIEGLDRPLALSQGSIDSLNGQLAQISISSIAMAGAGTGVAINDLQTPPQLPQSPKLPVNNGSWDGEAGNSGWFSTIPEVLSVTRGAPVQFRSGIPDFTPWNRGAPLNIPNLTGKNVFDQSLGLKSLVQRNSFVSAAGAKAWLQSEVLTFHHNINGVSLELVPSALHNQIPHTGGASVLRNWNSSVTGPFRITSTGTAWDVFQANRIARVGRGIGIAGMAYGAYVDGSSLYGQLKISGQTGRYGNSIAEGARIAGGWAGAAVLGGVGAEFGATVGLIGGPVGVAVGGLVGGAIGGAIGYWGVSGAITDITR